MTLLLRRDPARHLAAARTSTSRQGATRQCKTCLSIRQQQ